LNTHTHTIDAIVDH